MNLKSCSLAITLLCLASVVLIADSKVFQGEVKFSDFLKDPKVRTAYIGRMGFEVGEGEFIFNIKYKYPLPSKPNNMGALLTFFYGIIDDDWDSFHKADNCDDKLRKARAGVRVESFLHTDGSPAEVRKGHVKQYARTRVWHFFISDCFKYLPEEWKTLDNAFVYTLELKNTGGSHISQEEEGLLGPHLIMTAIFFFFFGHTLFKLIGYYKKEEQIDYPLLVLDAACFLEFMALLFETLHLLTTKWYGESAFGTDFLSSIFSVLAQFTMTLLLILIATGWSITYGNIEDLDLLIPLGALVATLHLIFAIVGKIGEDDPLKMHDYDSWAGVVLVIVRIIFFAIFMGFAVNTYKKAQKKIQAFVGKIMFIGMVYLLTIPVVVTIASVFVDHLWRHWVITLGNMILQAVTVMLFAFQFTTKGSSYNAVSLKNSIFLPAHKAD